MHSVAFSTDLAVQRQEVAAKFGHSIGAADVDGKHLNASKMGSQAGKALLSTATYTHEQGMAAGQADHATDATHMLNGLLCNNGVVQPKWSMLDRNNALVNGSQRTWSNSTRSMTALFSLYSANLVSITARKAPGALTSSYTGSAAGSASLSWEA